MSEDPAALALAGRLARRLCHDLLGPAGGVRAVLDMAVEGGADAETLALAADGARRVVDLLVFARAAYGGGTGALAPEAVNALIAPLFEGIRARLVCEITADAPEVVARLALHLAQMAGAAAFAGGEVRLRVRPTAGGWSVEASAVGERARLAEAVAAGLAGDPAPAGPEGGWLQAAFVRALAAEAGGRVSGSVTPEGVRLEAIIAGV